MAKSRLDVAARNAAKANKVFKKAAVNLEQANWQLETAIEEAEKQRLEAEQIQARAAEQLNKHSKVLAKLNDLMV